MNILASYGISATAEDLAALTGTSAKSRELSEKELMQISGGFSSGGRHGREGGGGGRF